MKWFYCCRNERESSCSTRSSSPEPSPSCSNPDPSDPDPAEPSPVSVASIPAENAIYVSTSGESTTDTVSTIRPYATTYGFSLENPQPENPTQYLGETCSSGSNAAVLSLDANSNLPLPYDKLFQPPLPGTSPGSRPTQSPSGVVCPNNAGPEPWERHVYQKLHPQFTRYSKLGAGEDAFQKHDRKRSFSKNSTGLSRFPCRMKAVA